MAGSLNHIVNPNTGQFETESIENLGDAWEALDECFHIIMALTGGKRDRVNVICDKLNFPRIKHDMTASAQYQGPLTALKEG